MATRNAYSARVGVTRWSSSPVCSVRIGLPVYARRRRRPGLGRWRDRLGARAAFRSFAGAFDHADQARNKRGVNRPTLKRGVVSVRKSI